MPEFYTIQEVLSFAIRLEQASQEFYRQLSGKVTQEAVSQYLLRLVHEEELHEAQLQLLLDEQGGTLDRSISADEVKGYVEAMDIPQELNYAAAVKLAMNKEKSAQMLYSVLAGIMEDKSLKDIFLLLSAQEKAHRAFFEKEYHRIQIGEN